MTADNFVKIVREKSDKLRVDDIVLKTADKEFHGKGILRIEPGKIQIDMTLNEDEIPPSQSTGVFTKRDSWQLSGLIQSHLRFQSKVRGPNNTNCFNTTGPDGKSETSHTLSFGLHPIELIPTKLDSMSLKERADMWAEIEKQSKTPTRKKRTLISKNIPFSFDASLFKYRFICPTWEKEFTAKLEDYTLKIAVDETSKDVRLSLRSNEDYNSSGIEDDWKKFYGLMNALSFMHGTHAWPYRIEYWRDGSKITDRVTAVERLPKTSHYPFPESFVFSSRTGSVKWDFEDTLGKAFAFFCKDSVLSKEAARLFFLFREADDSVHSEITTLALCTLFESLVRLIFKELDLEKQIRREDITIGLFDDARNEINAEIKKRIKAKGDCYSRLLGAQPTSAFTPREMFRAIVGHFGLKWENDMEVVFKTWKDVRNPMSHGQPRFNQSEDELKESILNESRIAGAINILFLKLIGFSGPMRASAFEDKYRQI